MIFLSNKVHFHCPFALCLLLLKVAERIKKKEITIDGFSQCELHPQIANKSAADWIFLIDTLNFCFWSADKNNKWTVNFNGKSYTGYFALCAAIQRAIKVCSKNHSVLIHLSCSIYNYTWST